MKDPIRKKVFLETYACLPAGRAVPPDLPEANLNAGTPMLRFPKNQKVFLETYGWLMDAVLYDYFRFFK